MQVHWITRASVALRAAPCTRYHGCYVFFGGTETWRAIRLGIGHVWKTQMSYGCCVFWRVSGLLGGVWGGVVTFYPLRLRNVIVDPHGGNQNRSSPSLSALELRA